MKTITNTLIALTSSALLMAPGAFAGEMHKTDMDMSKAITSAGVVDNNITDVKTEADLFMNHLNTGVNQLKAGNYDTAYQQLNDARYWFLAASDSVATESGSHPYSWDDVRSMESKLLTAYRELGQTQHIAGNYQDAVNILNVSLALSPIQPEAKYQRDLAFEAIVDANDMDVIDAELQKDVDAVKTDVQKKVDSVKTEVKKDVSTIKNEVKNGVDTLDNQVQEGLDTLDTEIQEEMN